MDKERGLRQFFPLFDTSRQLWRAKKSPELFMQ